jgi:hypothetical protein
LLTVGSQKKKKEETKKKNSKEIWQLKQEMKTTWGFCSLANCFTVEPIQKRKRKMKEI